MINKFSFLFLSEKHINPSSGPCSVTSTTESRLDKMSVILMYPFPFCLSLLTCLEENKARLKVVVDAKVKIGSFRLVLFSLIHFVMISQQDGAGYLGGRPGPCVFLKPFLFFSMAIRGVFFFVRKEKVMPSNFQCFYLTTLEQFTYNALNELKSIRVF